MARALAAAFVVMAMLLGWGYWHAVTHAWLVVMVSGADWRHMPRLERLSLRFFDERGEALAAARLDGIGELFHDNAPAGDCNALARLAHRSRADAGRWRRCSRELSRWVSGWAPLAHTVELRMDDCAPVMVVVRFHTVMDEWWLWWVPLPHVGGRPSTSYQLDLVVDPAVCAIGIRNPDGTLSTARP